MSTTTTDTITTALLAIQIEAAREVLHHLNVQMQRIRGPLGDNFPLLLPALKKAMGNAISVAHRELHLLEVRMAAHQELLDG